MKRTDDQLRIIIDCGRELGEKWLRSAVETAENQDQLIDQVDTLQVAAQHMLAVFAYNLSANSESFKTAKEMLEELFDETRVELELLCREAATMELVEPDFEDDGVPSPNETCH